MKKNKMMRLASGLLVAVLLTTCAISGTFAKYVSKAESEDSARVARWDIQLNDKSISETFKFDLFETVLDTDGTPETDVATANDTTLIAPGTKGEFTIKLKNLSEVTAKYAIDYTVKNDDEIPVMFSVNGQDWDEDLADVVADDVNTKLAMGAEATSIKVQWKWAYDGDDVKDTGFGTAQPLSTIEVKAVVTVTQVD